MRHFEGGKTTLWNKISTNKYDNQFVTLTLNKDKRNRMQV